MSLFPISKRFNVFWIISYMQFSRYMFAPLTCRSHSLRWRLANSGSASQTPRGMFTTERFLYFTKDF